MWVVVISTNEKMWLRFPSIQTDMFSMYKRCYPDEEVCMKDSEGKNVLGYQMKDLEDYSVWRNTTGLINRRE